MKTLSDITITLRPTVSNRNYAVIVPYRDDDLINNWPLAGRFEESVKSLPEWNDLLIAAMNKDLSAMVSNRRYGFEFLHPNGVFLLVSNIVSRSLQQTGLLA